MPKKFLVGWKNQEKKRGASVNRDGTELRIGEILHYQSTKGTIKKETRGKDACEDGLNQSKQRKRVADAGMGMGAGKGAWRSRHASRRRRAFEACRTDREKHKKTEPEYSSVEGVCR